MTERTWEQVSDFAKERADKVAEAVRDALRDENGDVGAAFVLLLPCVEGCMQMSNMSPEDAMTVQVRNISSRVAKGLADAIVAGGVTVIPLGSLVDDDDDDKPDGKVH